jgi:hypothetical protein
VDSAKNKAGDTMLSSVLLLVIGSGTGYLHRAIVTPPVDRTLFDSPANAWVSTIRESAKDREMLWDAQRVLFYAGRVTGDSDSMTMVFGYRIPRLRVGWHSVEPVHSLPSSDQFRLTQTFTGQNDRPVVIVVDQRDYADSDGYQAVADKVEDLERDRVERVTVMLRGVENQFCHSPPTIDMLLLDWIGDAELTVLVTHDFGGYPMVNQDVLTLNSRMSSNITLGPFH